MSDFLVNLMGCFLASLISVLLNSYFVEARLSERHCAAVTDRHAFEQCKKEFLTPPTGDKK